MSSHLVTVTGTVRTAGSLRPGIETILLVEDDSSVRTLIRKLLERLGYTVLEAGDPEQATEVAERFREPIHLLITDIGLPGVNGRELAKRLGGIHPEAKMLYISGHSLQKVAGDGLVESESFFLRKPFTWNALANRVRQTLDEGQNVSSAK